MTIDEGNTPSITRKKNNSLKAPHIRMNKINRPFMCVHVGNISDYCFATLGKNVLKYHKSGNQNFYAIDAKF